MASLEHEQARSARRAPTAHVVRVRAVDPGEDPAEGGTVERDAPEILAPTLIVRRSVMAPPLATPPVLA